jgi:RNA recognition motif-containing protein
MLNKMPYTSKPQTNATRTTGSPISSTVWIGSISPDSSEQEVLDFAATIGKVIKFDFMYHDGKAGNLPRGYAFATYCGKKDIQYGKILQQRDVGQK